ncbi:unnamed protein product [Victoria cruziana]
MSETAAVVLGMKVEEEDQQRGIEDGIEAPSLHTAAAPSTARKVLPKEDGGHGDAEEELEDLEVGDHPLPLGGAADAAGEVVSVHKGVDGSIGDESDDQEGLNVLQPQVAHHHHDRVVVDVQERQRLPFQQDEDGVRELEDLGEVEDVTPEEDGAAGLSAQREAEKPIDVGHLPGCGKGATDGHDEGEEEEEEVVEPRRQAEAPHRRPVAHEEPKAEDGGDIGDDGE